jgi:hypothetical protein
VAYGMTAIAAVTPISWECEKCYSLSLIAGQAALLYKLDVWLTLGKKQWKTEACFLSLTSVGFRGL